MESGAASPVERESTPFDTRPPLREEWETESEVMGSFDRMTPSEMDRFLHMPLMRDEHSNSRPWNVSTIQGGFKVGRFLVVSTEPFDSVDVEAARLYFTQPHK